MRITSTRFYTREKVSREGTDCGAKARENGTNCFLLHLATLGGNRGSGFAESKSARGSPLSPSAVPRVLDQKNQRSKGGKKNRIWKKIKGVEWGDYSLPPRTTPKKPKAKNMGEGSKEPLEQTAHQAQEKEEGGVHVGVKDRTRRRTKQGRGTKKDQWASPCGSREARRTVLHFLTLSIFARVLRTGASVVAEKRKRKRLGTKNKREPVA